MHMDLASLIHKEPTIIDPARGDLLIAEPLMLSPYFKRSAVMLLDKDSDGGHLGLVMNMPTPVSLGDLFPDWKNAGNVKIYCGGPVESDRLFMLHTMGDRFKDSMEVIDGLYVGADLDEVVEYIREGNQIDGKIRFFLGYSGWSNQQLSSEILNNNWAVNRRPQSTELLMGGGEEYWRREVELMGEKYKSWLLVPSDPELN